MANEEEVFLKAKNDALKLLSFRPRSVEELKAKLRQKKYSDEITQRVTDHFAKAGLVDDKKFARLLVNSLVYSKPAGRRQLEFDLKKKGLSGEVVREALADLGEYDEKKTAKELALGRLRHMTGIPDPKKKVRIFSFLQRRGFSQGVVFSVLSELFRGDVMMETDSE